jgi:hypothetical protein
MTGAQNFMTGHNILELLWLFVKEISLNENLR